MASHQAHPALHSPSLAGALGPACASTLLLFRRCRDFQLQSLKLLAQQLLLSCPGRPQTRESLFIPGELSLQRLRFRSNVLLYTSPHNPGACEVGTALRAGTAEHIEVTSDPGAINGLQGGATHFRAPHLVESSSDARATLTCACGERQSST